MKVSVLSLFDGMACGMLAMQKAGLEVDRYVAYEIDKYAIKTSSHNFPNIEHRGDVFQGDFTQYKGCDFLVGGSPCVFWSISQTKNRETEANGLGWELFSQYIRALHEAEPRYFIYENNKSMSNAIRDSISKTFGFEPVYINSALLSAQNRQRLYWVGKKTDRGYSPVKIEQPEDRGILLRDILESGVVDREKAYVLKHQTGNTRDYFKKHHTQIVFEPIRIGVIENDAKNSKHDSKQYRVYSADGKSVTLCGNGGGIGAKTGLYAVPIDCPTLAKPIYKVRDGLITIKGKQYPINLLDGYYIIRKLTVLECMRLQTVPEWFEFPVSNTQAYKMLGNGWTIDVITHLINAIKEECI